MSLRFFLYFTFSFLILLPCAYAQGENPYDKASPSQLKEAQSYYSYCKNDSAMNAEKDCRCASAAFLDARMALGDEASKRDIAKRVRYKCYKFASAAPDKEIRDTPKDDDYFKEVTDNQIKEAQGIYLSCKENQTMSRYHDCECMGASFLELRLQKGPIPKQDIILQELKDKCKNVVDGIGAEYSGCMSQSSNDQYGFERKDYCECYARKWAEAYEKVKGELTLNRDISIKATVKTYCQESAGIEAEKQRKIDERAAQ